MSQPALGIDFGTKRIGVAISHGSLAQPLEIVANDEQHVAIDRISQICQDKEVSVIVVGLSENKMADLTKNFVEELREKTQLPIVYIDETLSSYEMHQKLRDSKKKKKQGPIDHFVAAQLLQEWLDDN